jgi:hypothetical protein
MVEMTAINYTLMNMKTKLLLILFLFVTSVVSAQESKKVIEAQFSEYLKSIVEKDFNKTLSYAPDEMFKEFPRDKMLLLMEQTFNNPELEFSFIDPKILEIGESELIAGKYYSILKYSITNRLKFNGPADETEEEHKLRIGILKQTFRPAIDEGKAKFDEETETISMFSESEVFAISKDGLTDWRFIKKEKSQRAILEKILPKQLIK